MRNQNYFNSEQLIEWHQGAYCSSRQNRLSIRLVIHTLFIVETQLPSFVLAPAKHSPRQREGEAVVSSCRYLGQRNPCQGLERLRQQLAGLPFAQTQLAVGVLPPREQLTIFTRGESRQSVIMTHSVGM